MAASESKPGEQGRASAFTLSVGASPIADFEVVHVRGREAVQRGYRFDVRFLTRTDHAGFANASIGARACLGLRSSESSRFVHGVVSRVRALGVTSFGRDVLPLFEARIVPRVAFFSLRKTSRIFQDKTVPEIVTELVGAIGAKIESTLLRDYAKRDYCLQYQETDHDFVRRLLAEEGIFTFFQHPSSESASASDSGGEVLVLADAPPHYPAVDGERQVAFRDRGALAGDESVTRFVVEQSLRGGGVLVRGFDYEKPKFVPVAEAHCAPMKGAAKRVADEAALRTYDHDRILEWRTAPRRAADLRLDELRVGATRARGESSARRLFAGAQFTLAEHPAAELNTAWAITEVTHEGEQPLPGVDAPTTYRNEFLCVDATVAARPRRPERRLQQVTETALVVGPPGEEIHTDALGRIKIQFHWDLEGRHDDKSSCWVRVMQPWAAATWGSQFVPRVGMEVVVTFDGGDTDRPLVLGSVYNGVTPTPFALPKQKTRSGLRTRSTPGGTGFNELSFEDAAGAEQVYLHAERDFDEVVQRDHTRTVHGKEAVTVKESRITEIAEDNVRIVRGSEVVLVEKNFVLNIAGSKLIQVGRPPEESPADQASQALPESASAFEKYRALASMPMFDDPARAQAARVRRSMLLFESEQLDGAEYVASQSLVGHATATDKMLDALAGAAQLLTDDIASLPERVREAQGSHAPITEVLNRADVILDRAHEMEQRIRGTIAAQAASNSGDALAKIERALVEHLGPGLDKARALVQRLEVYVALLSNPAELLRGRGDGGGGGTDSKFNPADVTMSAYDPGKKEFAPLTKPGSKMVISDGPGEIEAPLGFRIHCGGSEIDMTPGSISIKSSGPIKINGSEILLNG